MPDLAVPNGRAAVEALFGAPRVSELSGGNCRGDAAWESENLVVIHDCGGSGLSVQVHHLIAERLADALRAAQAACPDYKVRMLGGYCPRHERHDPRLPLSLHTYGCAVDINWDVNGMGRGAPRDIPQEFVDVLEGYGFRWGGHFSVPDFMHYQFANAT